MLVRVSAYMDPWGATPPMDWWTVVNRCRALENMAFVVAANQGASLTHYPPFSWPGGSMVVDYDGRILAQANPGRARRSSWRRSTSRRCGPSATTRAASHARHLRTEAYPVYAQHVYPPAGDCLRSL